MEESQTQISLPTLIDDQHHGIINVTMHMIMQSSVVRNMICGNVGIISYNTIIKDKNYDSDVFVVRHMVRALDYIMSNARSQAELASYPVAIWNSPYPGFMRDFVEICEALYVVSRKPEQFAIAWKIGMDHLHNEWNNDMTHLIVILVARSIGDYMTKRENCYKKWAAMEMTYAIAMDRSSLVSLIMPDTYVDINMLVDNIIDIVCKTFDTIKSVHFGVHRFGSNVHCCASHIDSCLVRRDNWSGQTTCISETQNHARYDIQPEFLDFSTRANMDIRASDDESKCSRCEHRATHKMSKCAFSTVAIFIFRNDCADTSNFAHTIMLPTLVYAPMDSSASSRNFRLVPGIYRKCAIVSQCGQDYNALMYVTSDTQMCTNGSHTIEDVKHGKVCMVMYNLINTTFVTHNCSNTTVRIARRTYVSHIRHDKCTAPHGECTSAHEKKYADKDDDEPEAKKQKQ